MPHSATEGALQELVELRKRVEQTRHELGISTGERSGNGRGAGRPARLFSRARPSRSRARRHAPVA